jgi:hypothetical protein
MLATTLVATGEAQALASRCARGPSYLLHSPGHMGTGGHSQGGVVPTRLYWALVGTQECLTLRAGPAVP